VYATAVNAVAEQQQRVKNGCELIRNTPGIFERVRQSLIKSAVRCVEARGQHSGHFLQLVIIQTEICNVGIKYFLRTDLYFIFYPSPSKIQWVVTQRRSVQGPVFASTVHRIRPKVMPCISETPCISRQERVLKGV
jgi:hypothetical protein